MDIGRLITLLALGLPLAALAARPPTPQAVQGVVSKVDEGDSLWLSTPGQAPVAVHLRNIDAPEICQTWGEESRRALAELALNKPATLRATGRDGAGRLVGTVLVDGTDVAKRMVEEGHAWSVRTRWDRGPLVKQELMAKALNRGLHGAGGAVMPSEFRKSHGPCAN